MKKNEDNVWTQAAAQFQENLNQSWTQALANFQGVGATASPDTSHPALHFSTEKLESLRESYLKDATALMAENWISGKMELQDKRFSSAAWAENPLAAFSAAVYLLNTRTMLGLADAVDSDPKTRNRVRFAVEQCMAAAAPSNFLAFNADAQKKAIDTQGESIAMGIKNLLHDVKQGHVSMTDESLFTVGKNVATTEGAVVFENDYFQLLEYKPLSAKVFENPFLLVPPCINKYYILDLQPENSLVRYAVAQGHRTFVVSWRNPDASLATKSWDNYIEEAVIKAIHVTRDIAGKPAQEESINALGFCVGGTMLAAGLAVAAAKGQSPVASLTLLTSMVDFKETGPLGVFVDEQHASLREQQIGQGGLMSARELGTTFSFLRPNELVWNYVVSNYLKGESPVAFDLLFWNGDSTNLPGPFFTWYFRNTYLENKLSQPNALTSCGVPIDLRKVKVPTYLYGSREDHIVPWHSAFASTAIFPGPNRFVLGASGHIAGVINPPAKNKRNYWVADKPVKGQAAEKWFAQATEYPGSWWRDWGDWLATHSGKRVKASKTLGNQSYPVLEKAPGSYVKVRAV